MGKTAARHRRSLDLVGDQHIDHAVAGLHVARADLLGRDDAEAEAAAFDHRRPVHADIAGACGDDQVATARQRGIAGKAASGRDADQRHLPGQPRKTREGRDEQAGDDGRIGIARPPAAALGEQQHRQPMAQREIEHAIGLLVVAQPLRAGQNGRVVGHDDAAPA